MFHVRFENLLRKKRTVVAIAAATVVGVSALSVVPASAAGQTYTSSGWSNLKPTSGCPVTILPVLKVDLKHRNGCVLLAQSLLNKKLKNHGSVIQDGVFGPDTRNAVRAFKSQEKFKNTKDPGIGFATWANLLPVGEGGKSAVRTKGEKLTTGLTISRSVNAKAKSKVNAKAKSKKAKAPAVDSAERRFPGAQKSEARAKAPSGDSVERRFPGAQ